MALPHAPPIAIYDGARLARQVAAGEGAGGLRVDIGERGHSDA